MKYEFRLAIYKVIIEKRKNFTLEDNDIEQIKEYLSLNIKSWIDFYLKLLLYTFNGKEYTTELQKDYNNSFLLYLNNNHLQTNANKVTIVNQDFDGRYLPSHYKRNSLIHPLLDNLDLTINQLKDEYEFLQKLSIKEFIEKIKSY